MDQLLSTALLFLFFFLHSKWARFNGIPSTAECNRSRFIPLERISPLRVIIRKRKFGMVCRPELISPNFKIGCAAFWDERSSLFLVLRRLFHWMQLMRWCNSRPNSKYSLHT